MLRDDRVRGLATEFGGNWLDFRRFEEHNSVDRERFPTFNDELRAVDVRGADPLLHRPGPQRPPGARFPRRRTTRSSTRPSPATTACPSRAGGPDEWVRVDDAHALRPRRAPADGGLPDQERAGPADQPGQARLLGRPPAARREHPGAAGQRPRAARRRGQARRADPARDAGPAPRRQELRRLPRAVRRDRPGLRGLRPRRRIPDASTSAAGPWTPARRSPAATRGPGSTASARTSARTARRNSSRTCAASCWPTPSDAACSPRTTTTIEAMRTRLAADGYRFGGLVESIVTSPQFRNKRVRRRPGGGMTTMSAIDAGADRQADRRRAIPADVPPRRGRHDGPAVARVGPRLGLRADRGRRAGAVPEAVRRPVHGLRRQPDPLVGQGPGAPGWSWAVPGAAGPADGQDQRDPRPLQQARDGRRHPSRARPATSSRAQRFRRGPS